MRQITQVQLFLYSACQVKVLTFEERFIISPAECALQIKGNNELYLHALAESPSGQKKGWSFSKGYPARVIFGLYRFFWLTHRCGGKRDNARVLIRQVGPRKGGLLLTQVFLVEVEHSQQPNKIQLFPTRAFLVLDYATCYYATK